MIGQVPEVTDEFVDAHIRCGCGHRLGERGRRRIRPIFGHIDHPALATQLQGCLQAMVTAVNQNELLPLENC
jgi:hypothetical protein